MKTKPTTSSIYLLSALAAALCIAGCSTPEPLTNLSNANQIQPNKPNQNPDQNSNQNQEQRNENPPDSPLNKEGNAAGNATSGGPTFVRACPDTKVLFATDVYSVSAADATKLVNDLRACGDLKALNVSVAGHTDIVGTATYNDALSSKRAYSVASILKEQIHLEIPAANIVGHGENQPEAVAPEGASAQETREADRKNRRAVVTVTRR